MAQIYAHISGWADLNFQQDDIPFAAYECVAKALYKAGYIWQWCFWLLSFNLMSRSCNIAEINYNLFGWSGDMMTLLHCHTKAAKGEKKRRRAVHMASNPLKPWLCCPTAVALTLMSNLRSGQKLLQCSTKT